jgi:hypothetical protein
MKEPRKAGIRVSPHAYENADFQALLGFLGDLCG